MFGRKRVISPQTVVSPIEEAGAAQGHVATLEHAHAAGEMFFELTYRQMAQTGDAVGIENFLGLLSTAGGVACIATALCEYEIVKLRPHDANLLLQQEVAGESYFIGDLPTRYLYEGANSLLNIALPYAMKHGAAIEHDFLHEPVKHAMNSVGTPAFGIPRLPRENMPDAPLPELALCAWPQAEHSFETMNLAIEYRPAALGYAIGKALDTAAGALDPLLMARIVVECAVPMAMIDPSRFLPRLNELKANAA